MPFEQPRNQYQYACGFGLESRLKDGYCRQQLSGSPDALTEPIKRKTQEGKDVPETSPASER